MRNPLIQKLSQIRDVKSLLESGISEIQKGYQTKYCQVSVNNPLEPNNSTIFALGSTKDLNSNYSAIDFPLVAFNRNLGQLTLIREQKFSSPEIQSIEIILNDFSKILLNAQSASLLQNETSLSGVLLEINSMMSYAMGLGDTLFMVVNILGKLLNTSRCMFICTVDASPTWKCFEFWQQDKVESLHSLSWPTSKSAIVAQTFLSKTPFFVYEGRDNSFMLPVQEELQLIGVKSLLGVPLKGKNNTHGCVILQQCDYRRFWTQNHIDIVLNVANSVANAIDNLSLEKKIQEPIMQLYQREIQIADNKDNSINSVRNALKGAMGQQALPSFNQVKLAPKPTPKPPVAPTSSVAMTQAITQPVPSVEPVTAKPVALDQQQAVVVKPVESVKSQVSADSVKSTANTLSAIDPSQSLQNPDTLTGQSNQAPSEILNEIDSVLQSIKTSTNLEEITHVELQEIRLNEVDQSSLAEISQTNADISISTNTVVTEPQPKAGPPKSDYDLTALDSIPSPNKNISTSSPQTAWGNLDSIPTPKNSENKSGGGGLGKLRFGKKGISREASQSNLLASLYKDKSMFEEKRPIPLEVEHAPVVEIDENAAKNKLNQILQENDETSEYIFATPNLHPKTASRIESWLNEIQGKDKYLTNHALTVARISEILATSLGLNSEQVLKIRKAALLHDVGKLGIPQNLLEKPDDDLSDVELVMVMDHASKGCLLLESFEDLQDLSLIINSHHEEFDGNGYPEGLAGESIPLEARIIFLANSFHEQTSITKWRSQQPDVNHVIEDIKNNSGKKYDPNVVNAFLHSLQQITVLI